MDLPVLTSFFLWCTIINGGLLILWTILFMAIPDFVYRTQSRWFPMPKETFHLVFYCFLGIFKICFLFFNVVPYIALRILG